MKSKLSGCTIDFSPNLKLKLKDQIGYGSFSFVYSTNDSRYVVKMINASDPKSLVSYNNEKYAFQHIPKHENIINCPVLKDSVFYKDITYCCLVLENCARGSVITLIVDKKVTFQEHQILQVLLDVLCGLHQMHNVAQPIAHRDLKGENVLLGPDGRFKLTDFGSNSTKRLFEITRENREAVQDEIDKNTTPTIRAPEQCDLYSGFPITEKVDIWALGCLLYILCFQKQPFETKLSTINCQYFISDGNKYSKKLLDLFPFLFVINPEKRPTTSMVLSYFEANFQSLSRTPFLNLEIPGASKEQRPQKHQEAKYIPNFGDFGKSSMPTEFAYSNSDRKIKPSFRDSLQKKIKALTTKTEAWMLASLKEKEEGPDQRYIRYLIIKAWQKPHKIRKFYVLFHKKIGKDIENTLIILKGLVLLHNYCKKGPNDVYFQKANNNIAYPKAILDSIYETWRTIVQNNVMTNRDKARDAYISNIIVEYCRLLNKKAELLQQHFRTLEGNYSINPFLSHRGEDNSPLTGSVMLDLLNYLQGLIDFHRIILLKKNLWVIQCNIGLSVLDEEYGLISLLTHLILAYKRSTNYLSPKDNKESVRNNLKQLEERFITYYEELQKLFDSSSKLEGFSQHRGLIPTLPQQVIKGIQSIQTFMEGNGQVFYSKDHLSTNKSICGLKIPLSYGTFIKNINLDHFISVEEETFENKHILNLPMQKEEGLSRPLEDIKHKGLEVVSKDSVSKAQSVQKEMQQKVDFNPDFDAFNQFQSFKNFEQHENQALKLDNVDQANLFAGFNFQHDVPKEAGQKMNDFHAWASPVKEMGAKEQPIEIPKDVVEEKKTEIVALDEKLHKEVDNLKPTNLHMSQIHNSNNPISLDQALMDAGEEFDHFDANEHANNDPHHGKVEEKVEAKQEEHIDTKIDNENNLAILRNAQRQEHSLPQNNNIKFLPNRPNIRAAMIAKGQGQLQINESDNILQQNQHLVGGDGITFDSNLSATKETLQNSNVHIRANQSPGIDNKNKVDYTEAQDVLNGKEGVGLHAINVKISEEGLLNSQNLNLSGKRQTSAPEQLEGDAAIDSDHSNSKHTSPQKENNFGSHSSNMVEHQKIDGKVEDREEEKKEEVQKETDEFTFEALYASAFPQEKSSGLKESRKGMTDTAKNDYTFGTGSQLKDLKQSDAGSKQKAGPNTGLMLSGNEITTSNLKEFIFNEASKNIADWVIDYSQLKFLEQVGAGGSAQVYRGIWRGTEVAIKKMNLEQLPENRKKEFEREIAALMKLRPHQNLVNFMGVSLNNNDLCIITEFCSGGTLFEWLHMKKEFPITWQQRIKLAIDVACGMNYLHTCNPPIIHRDLKSLNLLLDGPLELDSQRFLVKLGDFGLAKTEEVTTQEMRTGLLGTFHWMAPEIFDNKIYTVKADVYSFGVVLYEIVTRETPYPELKTPIAIMRHVSLEKQRPDLSKVPNDCPKGIVELMVKCWDHEPQNRPDFAEILEKLKVLKY